MQRTEIYLCLLMTSWLSGCGQLVTPTNAVALRGVRDLLDTAEVAALQVRQETGWFPTEVNELPLEVGRSWQDPWKNELRLESVTVAGKQYLLIISDGPDGLEATADDIERWVPHWPGKK